MKNTKGLSMIVTSLIIILLVIVAIGILYVAYMNFVRTGVGSVDIGTKCINVDVRASMVECSGDPAICNVTLTRTATGEEIAGVKLVFEDASGDASNVTDVPGNIPVLGTVKKIGYNTTLTSPNKVKVTVYFEDESGKEQICSTTSIKEL
jgi:hypothetical protein